MLRDLLSYLSNYPVSLWAPGLKSMMAAVHPQTERAIARKSGAVAVVPIRGVITPRATPWEMSGLATSLETVVRGVKAALAEEDVKAVVLDVDSPGGSMSGLPEAFDELISLRGKKPIVAHADFMAASAAYYIASAADEIVASPSALVGSIGVYILHVDQSKMLEDFGLKVTFVKAGEDKTLANSLEPLTEEGQSYLQAIVDDGYAQFIKDVARGRGIKESTVISDFGQGRVLVPEQALKVGMVDKVRSLPETLKAYGIADISQKTYARRSAENRLRLVNL